MTARARRTERRPDRGRIRLTERDRWLLDSVGRLGYATTGQLAHLGFGASRGASRRRLRWLFDAGYLRVWVPRLDGENIYTLARRGALVCDGAYPVPRGLDGRLGHLVTANSVRIAIALSVPLAGGELLAWQTDRELGGPAGVVPDAVFGIAWPEGRVRYLLEVDNRSRTPGAFARKLLRYAVGPYREAVLLVVGRDPRWLARYRAACARLPLGRQVWFAPLTAVEAEGARGAIWEPLRGERKVSLRGVAAEDTGEGRRDAEAPQS